MTNDEERYKGIFESTASCIAVLRAIKKGHNFVFVDFNPMAEKTEKISKDKVIGQVVTELFPGVIEFGLFDVFYRVWKKGKPELLPVCVYSDERIMGYRENYVYRLSNGDIVSVYRDLTEQKQAEEALQIRLTELEIFNDAAVDRELTINNLRKEVNKLLKESGKEAKYEIVE